MANPRKPTALRLLSGNPGKRPIPAAEPSYEPCDATMPDWLTGEAAALWDKLAAALHVNGMLTHASKDNLAVYCDVLGSYIDKRRSGAEADIKLLQQIRMMAREFGFTPSSQASVSAPAKQDTKDEKARFFG